MDTLTVAAVAFKLRPVRGTGEYFAHLTDLIQRAYDGESDVVVLPELHVLELLSLVPDLPEHKVAPYLAQFADESEEWLERISNSSDLTIVGGSHIRKEGEAFFNVGILCRPGQAPVRYAKNNLTRYEREMWNLTPGRGLALSDGLGVTVCYDSEFPAAALALGEAGAWVQATPAWTETVRGFRRVRNGLLARAVETQSYMVHASLVGDFGREPVPASYGSSAVIAPSVEPFPEDPILEETPLGEEGIALALLDRALVEEARTRGEVSNWDDRARGDWTVATPPSGEVSS